MPNNFGNAALTYREPKPRDGRRCFSPLARPVRGACTADDDPHMFAPRVWAPSAWLRPYVVDSTAEPAERGYALIEAA